MSPIFESLFAQYATYESLDIILEITGVVRFLAASRERGRDIAIPKTVDMNAIFNVSDIPIQAVEQVIENPRGALHSG